MVSTCVCRFSESVCQFSKIVFGVISSAANAGFSQAVQGKVYQQSTGGHGFTLGTVKVSSPPECWLA